MQADAMAMIRLVMLSAALLGIAASAALEDELSLGG